ncbi:MAG: hypothetical protein QMD46_11455 [Methanomicrobiales archaeon]|nr:hypothetical protein [Methanomicrobiales archaeon]
MGKIELLKVVGGLEKVEEDRLMGSPLTEFREVPVYRRFGTVVCDHIAPGAPGGQDVEDAIEEPTGIPSGPADVRFLGRQMLPENLPEVVVDFPKCYMPGQGSHGLIILGCPHSKRIKASVFGQYSSLKERGTEHPFNVWTCLREWV